MSSPVQNRGSLRFEDFSLDVATAELRKNGAAVRLAYQPARILLLLASRAGEIVTRDEIIRYIWGSDTYVGFDQGLNSAVRQIRAALGDDADEARFIETVPKRGYRFVAALQEDGPPPSTPNLAANGAENASAAIPTPSLPRRRHVRVWLALLCLFLAAGGTVAYRVGEERPALSFTGRDSVLITDFDNQTGDPRFDNALGTAFRVSLEQSRHANIFPQSGVSRVLQLMGKANSARLTPTLGREICLRENIPALVSCGITRSGNNYELTAELIEPRSGRVVRSYSEQSPGEGRILEGLDRIARQVRRDLGEPLYQIHFSARPLPEVTTPSLAALTQYANGLELWHQGKYDDAMPLFRAAVRADANFAMAHAALGNAYYSYIYNRQDLGEAEYEKALALASRTTPRERLQIQVEYAQDRGHIEEAAQLSRQYLSLYPGDWRMQANYAHLLRRHGRERQAIEEYKRLLALIPDDGRTYSEIATAYRSLGMFPQALEAYARAFQLDPQLLTAGDLNREYGFTLVANGEDDKAAAVFNALLANPETRESGLRSLALLDLYHGRYHGAELRLKDALALDQAANAPLSTARVHLWLALVAEGQGQRAGEARELQAAGAHLMSLGPKVVFGAFVGQVWARGGWRSQAANIEKLIAPAADPRNSEQMSYLHLLQGETALAGGNARQAITLLNLADRENDTCMTAEALAHAYDAAGDLHQAVAWYEKVLALPSIRCLSWEPQQRWVYAHYELARDYAAQDRTEDAGRVLTTLLYLWKDSDPDLPLRKEGLRLQSRLAARPQAGRTISESRWDWQ